MERTVSSVFSDEQLLSLKQSRPEDYAEVMWRIGITRLRAIYREELGRLESPLRHCLDRDFESLEQQFCERVLSPADYDGLHAMQWFVNHVGEAWFENQEYKDEEQA